MWAESDTARQWRELYTGTPFGQAHVPYVHAVAAALLARGYDLRDLRHETDGAPRSAVISMGEGTWLSWSESWGWAMEPADRLLPVSLVAEPSQIADLTDKFRAGQHVEENEWPGRDHQVPDLMLEAALAGYRDHPGHILISGHDPALGRWPQELSPAGIDGAALDELAERLEQTSYSAERLAMQVDPLRFEVSADLSGTGSEAVFMLDRVHTKPDLWTVQVLGTAGMFLDGTTDLAWEPKAMDLDRALRATRTAAAGWRQQQLEKHANEERRSAGLQSARAVGEAWPKPAGPSALRPATAAAPRVSRETPESSRER